MQEWNACIDMNQCLTKGHTSLTVTFPVSVVGDVLCCEI